MPPAGQGVLRTGGRQIAARCLGEPCSRRAGASEMNLYPVLRADGLSRSTRAAVTGRHRPGACKQQTFISHCLEATNPRCRGQQIRCLVRTGFLAHTRHLRSVSSRGAAVGALWDLLYWGPDPIRAGSVLRPMQLRRPPSGCHHLGAWIWGGHRHSVCSTGFRELFVQGPRHWGACSSQQDWIPPKSG